eukprot:scaffold162863_cov26-Tisochrysis_lutea.AAC.1
MGHSTPSSLQWAVEHQCPWPSTRMHRSMRVSPASDHRPRRDHRVSTALRPLKATRLELRRASPMTTRKLEWLLDSRHARRGRAARRVQTGGEARLRLPPHLGTRARAWRLNLAEA